MAKNDDSMSQGEIDMRHKSVISKWERRREMTEHRAEKKVQEAKKALAADLEEHRASLAQEIIEARNEGREGLRRLRRVLAEDGYSFETLKNNDTGIDD